MAAALIEQPACLLRQAELRTYRERVGQHLVASDESKQRPGVKVSVTVCHTAAQLYIADKDPFQWRLMCAGVPVVIDVISTAGGGTSGVPECARFIGVVDYKTSHLLWRQEVSAPLSPRAYRAAREDFHTFRGRQWAVGLLFAHGKAAERFRQVVLSEPERSAHSQSERPFSEVEAPPAQRSEVAAANVRADASKRSGGRRQLSKADISGPAHFVHVSHLGLGDLTTVKAVSAEQSFHSEPHKDDHQRQTTGLDHTSALGAGGSKDAVVITSPGRTPPRPRRRPPPPPPPTTPPSPPPPPINKPSTCVLDSHPLSEKEPLIVDQVQTPKDIDLTGTGGVKERRPPPIPARKESIAVNESKVTAPSVPGERQPPSLLEEITHFKKECLTTPKSEHEASSRPNLLDEIVQFNKKSLRSPQNDNSSAKTSDQEHKSSDVSAGQDMASVMQDAFAKMMQKFELVHKLEQEGELGEEDPFQDEPATVNT